MVYSSLPFLFVFLPALLLVYFAGPRAARNGVLTAASLLFYAWGGMDFFAILVAFIVSHWLAGLVLQRLRDRERRRAMRAVFVATLAADLGLIAWFKYANFAVAQANAFARWAGWPAVAPAWAHVLLPIGISFFTFQAISYLIDITRGTIRARRNPIDFALYEALFPQLIAGPIVRFAEIAEQVRGRRHSWDEFSGGLMRFAHGVGKKVLLADPVSLLADAAFVRPEALSLTEAWIGAMAYAIQIYFDFSGYSDMAIGLGRMFGFTLPENFNRPYSAATVTAFWRRWHMTLTRWFRDYLYFPLGGSRAGRARTWRNLVFVFVATALWHGANWTFLVWGLWHGGWLIAERIGLAGMSPDSRTAAGRARTLCVVLIGWVFFRAPTLPHALGYLQAMFGFGHGIVGLQMLGAELWYLPVLAWVAGVAVMSAPPRAPCGVIWTGNSDRPLRPAVALGYAGVLTLAVLNLVAGSASPFLYFRF